RAVGRERVVVVLLHDPAPGRRGMADDREEVLERELGTAVPGDLAVDLEVAGAIRQIVSGAIVSDEVIDVFQAAGLRKPDISILAAEFLAEVRGMPRRNLAVELLRTLLDGEIRSRSRRNLVQARSFAELLEQALRRYQNRAIETA